MDILETRVTNSSNRKVSWMGDNVEAKKGVFEKATNPFGEIKRVVAVMSGKGGVGKSSVTALLAGSLREKGFKVGVLDGDLTGPSIPKLFGVKEKAGSLENSLLPVETATGIKIISINLLLEKEDDPVIWRGPLISGVIKQFYSEVVWEDLDYLLVDLPPGTGDAPLTVMQSLPLTGLVIVSSPQDLVAMIVRKAVRMAEQLKIPIIGLIENMSYLLCPDCGKRIDLFGESKAKEVAANSGIKLLGTLPVFPEVAAMSDAGRIEAVHANIPGFFTETIENFLKNIAH